MINKEMFDEWKQSEITIQFLNVLKSLLSKIKNEKLSLIERLTSADPIEREKARQVSVSHAALEIFMNDIINIEFNDIEKIEDKKHDYI